MLLVLSGLCNESPHVLPLLIEFRKHFDDEIPSEIIIIVDCNRPDNPESGSGTDVAEEKSVKVENSG